MITISDAAALCNFVQQEESSNTSSMRAFLSYTRCRNAMACCSKSLISSRASSTAVTKQNVIFSGIQPTGEFPSEQRALQAETMSTKVHHTYVPFGQLAYLVTDHCAAWQLPWPVSAVPRNASFSTSADSNLPLNSRLACHHASSRSRCSRSRPERYACKSACLRCGS